MSIFICWKMTLRKDSKIFQRQSLDDVIVFIFCLYSLIFSKIHILQVLGCWGILLRYFFPSPGFQNTSLSSCIKANKQANKSSSFEAQAIWPHFPLFLQVLTCDMWHTCIHWWLWSPLHLTPLPYPVSGWTTYPWHVPLDPWQPCHPLHPASSHHNRAGPYRAFPG